MMATTSRKVKSNPRTHSFVTKRTNLKRKEIAHFSDEPAIYSTFQTLTPSNDVTPNPQANSSESKPIFNKKKVQRYFDQQLDTSSGQSIRVSEKSRFDKFNASSRNLKRTWRNTNNNINQLPPISEQVPKRFPRAPNNNGFALDRKPRGEESFVPDLRRPGRWKGSLCKLAVKHEADEEFPGRVPVAKDKLVRHSRGEGSDATGVRSKLQSYKLQKKEEMIEASLEQAARAELLLAEDEGFLEPGVGEVTRQFTQKQIAAEVDITSATKHFDLNLSQFGPYSMNYNRSGRYLLLGGRRGHVAAIDWFTKRLFCEMNVMEEVFDVKWLHTETMFAVAQKKWVYIYDNQGIELHCLKILNNVLHMEFLPYHFLLSTANESGFLTWLDISVGSIVSNFNTKQGRLNVVTQNPANATMILGHPKGVVTMWSPNVREPLAQMLCHKRPVQAVTVDHHGQYMATSDSNRCVRIWDLRMLKSHVQEYSLRSAATNLTFSQRRLLAIGMGNVVEVYKDCVTHTTDACYLRHKMVKSVKSFQFCPYEDVLGVGHSGGFTSLIIPGAGEPNFDGLESNPFQTKSQRKEAEVKSLLEKIQPEFITLDPSAISEVDLTSVKEKMEAVANMMHFKAPTLDLEHRKTKGKKGSAQKAKSKMIGRDNAKREFVKTVKNIQGEEAATSDDAPVSVSVLDRFKPKKTKQK